MAHSPLLCPSARGSGDGWTGKPRKVALITGITGQVSAEAGARPGLLPPGHMCVSPCAPGCLRFQELLLGVPEGVVSSGGRTAAVAWELGGGRDFGLLLGRVL